MGCAVEPAITMATGLHPVGQFTGDRVEQTTEFSCPSWGLSHLLCISLYRGLFPEAMFAHGCLGLARTGPPCLRTLEEAWP